MKKEIELQWTNENAHDKIDIDIHMVPGGTDKSEGGDYENRLRHVEFEGLVN